MRNNLGYYLEKYGTLKDGIKHYSEKDMRGMYHDESIPVELPVMLIFNEHFRWYKEDGQYFIEHPKWSLVGMGENLQDAHRDLLEEISITREHFINIPDEELTEEAKRMKYWLSVIKVKNSA